MSRHEEDFSINQTEKQFEKNAQTGKTRLEELVSKGCADIKDIKHLRYERSKCKKKIDTKTFRYKEFRIQKIKKYKRSKIKTN